MQSIIIKKCYVSLITQTEAQKSLPATGQKQWESTLLTLFDQQWNMVPSHEKHRKQTEL